MTWLENCVGSKGIWYKTNDKISASGVSTDYIFGFKGIGSPHGHLVIYNYEIIFNRPITKGIKTLQAKVENFEDVTFIIF